MSVLIFLKVFGDVCICSAVVSAFPVLLVYEYSLLWPALLCGAGAAVAALLSEHGNHKLRYLGLLLPCFTMLLAGTLLEYLILIPGVAYTAVVIIRGEFMLEYYSFREVFKRTLIALGVFAILIFLGRTLEEMTTSWTITMDHLVPLRYIFFYAVSGIFLMRQLRMGNSGADQSTMNRRQLWLVILGITVFLLILVGLERLLETYATSVFEALANCVKTIIMLPFLLIGWLFGLLLKQEDVQQLMEKSEVSIPTFDATLVPIPSGDPVMNVKENEPGSTLWAVILILVILLFVLLYLVRLFRTRGIQLRDVEVVDRITIEKVVKKEPARTNRGKVRRYYREFLKNEKRKGLKLTTSQTTADILEGVSKTTNRSAAAQLREVYLAARYAQNQEITSEHVKTARDSWKGTTKQ